MSLSIHQYEIDQESRQGGPGEEPEDERTQDEIEAAESEDIFWDKYVEEMRDEV